MNITEFRHAMNEELDRLEQHCVDMRLTNPDALDYWPEDMLFADWLATLDEYIG